ncbi:hypothetical protein ABZP36_018087 [Zizania latifolia]
MGAARRRPRRRRSGSGREWERDNGAPGGQGEEDVVVEMPFGAWCALRLRVRFMISFFPPQDRHDSELKLPFEGVGQHSNSTESDKENLPLEDVFKHLNTSHGGLSSADAEERFQLFGANRLEEKRENKIIKLLSFMWNPLSWVMEAAAVMALVLANGGSALTGESLPVTKRTGDLVFTGSTCKHGEIEAVVIATGSNSFFGKAAHLVDSTEVVGHFQKGAITKRMTAIEEMAGMDVLCCDKTGTLTLNHLTVDKNLIEVFSREMDREMIILLAARASRVENQDAIDMAIINMLADPKEARTSITEVHFLPFNPVDKRTAITYIDSDDNWFRVSKGAPEQILSLCYNKDVIAEKVQLVIDRFAERGLRSLAVAYQEVPEKSRHGHGGPWVFCGLLPLFDPPRHDSADTIRRALDLGVCVKMLTGDHLAIAKETGRRLGMGTNMYPSASLFGRRDAAIPVDELVEKADGFAGVFPEHKYEIVRILQGEDHVCGMTGDGVNDAPALKKADIGIAVSDATDAARGAADIVLTEPGLSVIVSAVLTSRAIFQRMKNYTIYAVSITIRIVLGFVLLASIWKYDFPPFMVLIIAILNDGRTIMTISKDRVKPSPSPDSWKLNEIFAAGVVIGTYLALVTVLFYWAVTRTTFFESHFKVRSLKQNVDEISSAMYLQVSIISQALIFVTRSQHLSFLEMPGALLICAFVLAQLVATLIAVYATISFASISAIGWGWAGVIWLYSLMFYAPLDLIKIAVRYTLSGEAWNLLFDRKAAFTSRRDYGKELHREAWWPPRSHERRAVSDHLLSSGWRPSLIAERAKRRAEIARLGEAHGLRTQVQSVMRLRRVDSDVIRTAQTV